MSVAQRRKRISKKNKAAWRKTDIKDVEDFLDEQRQEERIGTFTEKKDEDLFTVDVAPLTPKRTGLTDKQKRKLNAKKEFRSHESLKNTSKVQDPIVKRNTVRQKKAGRIIEEEVRNPCRPRHFQANKDRARYYEQLEKKLAPKDDNVSKTAKDVWAEEDFRDKLPGLKDEKGWISRELALYTSKNVGLAVIKVHDSIRHRTTKAKKFEAPHPGTSYNPSLEDHQQLISSVVGNEEKIIKTERHLKRVTTDMYSKVTPEERDQRQLKEMRAGLDEDELDENEDEQQEESESEDEKTKKKKKSKKTKKILLPKRLVVVDENAPYRTLNPPVENKKKSKQARRKVLQQKTLAKKQQSKLAQKKQVADLIRIKSIKAEVTAEAEELNELKKHRKNVAFKKKFDTKRLGRLKYVEPDADVNMAEDIAGNLRNVKSESSLLVDRFKNFQKRNILPTSVVTGKQKNKKVKRFPRATHKDPGVSFQMLREQRKAKTVKG